MVDEAVGGRVLVRREATTARVLVVDLLLEQHRRLAEQRRQHLDDQPAAHEGAQRLVVRDEVLAPCQHRSRVGLLEMMQTRPLVAGPLFEPADRRVERTELRLAQGARNDQPAVAPERLDVDRAECAASRARPVEFEQLGDGRRPVERRRLASFDPAGEPADPTVTARHDRHLRTAPRAAVLATERDRGPGEGPARLGPRHPHVRRQRSSRLDAGYRSDHLEQVIVGG